jgi:peptide/nickel transport system substrate-binding protein
MRGRELAIIVLVIIGVVACAPERAAPRAADQSTAAQARTRDAGPPLVVVTRSEVDTLAAKPVLARGAGLGDGAARRIFNAGLAINDGQGVPRAYLADRLPELRTASWQVYPDGRMETTYQLRPNLTWHDGAPLTADDFAFAWRVYATPQLGVAGSAPLNQMEEVVASDERTVTMRWRRPFPRANVLQEEDFQPLPRQLLEAALLSDAGEAFATRPFWTTEYVGLGPYRLERWESGSFIDAVAFDGHALGRPKIDRLRLRFIGDSNTVMANLLAGEANLTLPYTIYLQQGVVLRQQWAPTAGGSLLVVPAGYRKTQIQYRPELASPRGLLDLRVRKALAHALDLPLLNEALFEGETVLAASMIPPSIDYAADVDRAIARYPTDFRRSEQLMSEAAYARGADGIYVGATGERFGAELRATATADIQQEAAVMASQWRTAGFDVHETAVPLAQAQDGQVRAAFSGLQNWGGGIGEEGLTNWTTAAIPTSENRWTGANHGGWSNAAYDRLYESYSTTLERPERIRLVVEMAKIYTEELAAISLHYSPNVVARVAALDGPETFAPDSLPTWNVHEWRWRTPVAP